MLEGSRQRPPPRAPCLEELQARQTSRGVNPAWTPGPSDAVDLLLLSRSTSPPRNHPLPKRLKRLRDFFSTSSCHSLRFGGTFVPRFVIVARRQNITNPIADYGSLGINPCPTVGFGLNLPIILVCLTGNPRKRKRRKALLNGFWLSGSCLINKLRQTTSLPRPAILLLSPQGSTRLGILALEN